MRLPDCLRLPKGITRRITLLGWLVTLVTLAVFVVVIVPEQKREFQISLESKARGGRFPSEVLRRGLLFPRIIRRSSTKPCRFCRAIRRSTM